MSAQGIVKEALERHRAIRAKGAILCRCGWESTSDAKSLTDHQAEEMLTAFIRVLVDPDHVSESLLHWKWSLAKMGFGIGVPGQQGEAGPELTRRAIVALYSAASAAHVRALGEDFAMRGVQIADAQLADLEDLSPGKIDALNEEIRKLLAAEE